MMKEVYFRDIDHTNECTVKNIKLKPDICYVRLFWS